MSQKPLLMDDTPENVNRRAYEALIERLGTFRREGDDLTDRAWLRDFKLYASRFNVLFSATEIDAFWLSVGSDHIEALTVLKNRIDIEFGKPQTDFIPRRE